VRCLGVPIFGPHRRPLAAISLAGTTFEVPLEDVPRLADELLHASAGIGQAVTQLMTVTSVPSAPESFAS
jgi:DNA-binding IclR family transcriptional regulator